MAKRNTEEFLREARARFKLASEAEHRERQEMLEDLRFLVGDQWPEEIRKQRDMDRRPCLTINRIPQFVHQVTNEIRQNRPAPLVRPVDNSDGDSNTAEGIQGLIRHIERQSKADRVRSDAALYAAAIGRGFYRIITDFADYDSFDQEIYLKRIKNPFSVYFDPTCQEPDYSDAMWAFIIEDLTPEQYKSQFPGSEIASLAEFESLGDRAPDWFNNGNIRIAEYFCVEKTKATLALLADGSTVTLDQVPEGLPVIKTRETEICTVRWTKINGVEILDEKPWPGRWIPIIPVLGEELDVDGETKLIGMVRNSRDPQRMYNYWASAETEMIALAPRAPFIGAEGQFENHETAWASANTRNLAYLEYKPVGLAGTPLPPPQRNVVEPPIQAISMARMQSSDDLKATMGIYDAALGARSNEQSGKAILARQSEADVSNYHIQDNLATAIEHECRIYVDLIPKIYDRPGRVVRIIGEEDNERPIVINQPYVEKGVEKIYDLSAGKYDVSIQVGPSYKTQRQEAAEAMIQLSSSMPILGTAAPDLVVKVLDMPGAKELSDRLKKALPPGLADDEDKQMPIPPAVKAQMDQAMQVVDALTMQVNALTDEINTQKVQTDSKERIALAQLEVQREELRAKIALEQAKIASQEGIEQLWAELEVLKTQLAAAQADSQAEQEAVEADKDRDFQREQTDVQAAVTSTEADKDRQFQAEQAEFQAETSAEQADKDRAFQAKAKPQEKK